MNKKRLIVIFGIMGLLAGCATVKGLKPYEGEDFCGSSTFGSCSSDEDCFPEGCLKEVCQSRNESTVITACEWKDCLDAAAAGVSCKCLNGQCQWSKAAEEVSSVAIEEKAEEKVK